MRPRALLLMMLAGCEPSGPLQPGRTALCAEAILPNGFGLAWKKLNHRISHFSVAFDTAPATRCENGGGATLIARYVGGTYTTGEMGGDTPIARASYAVVGARAPSSTENMAALDVVLGEVPLTIDRTQSASAPLPVLTLPRASYAATVTALAGLELRTDVPQTADYPDYDPADGYTSRGLAAAVDDSDVSAAFRHGPADRADMNAAIPLAQTAAVVRLARIGLADGVVTRAQKTITHAYPKQEAFDEVPLPHIPVEKTRLEIAGARGFDRAALLITRVDFQLFPQTSDGEYVREISLTPRNIKYDSNSGRATVELDAHASNYSLFTFLAMELTVEIEVALLQWRGGGAVAQLAHDAEFTVDQAARIALPLEPMRNP